MKRRHSLSNRQTRYSNDQLNEFCTNGSNNLSSEQVIQQRSHSAPPDYQEKGFSHKERVKGLSKKQSRRSAARRERRKSRRIQLRAEQKELKRIEKKKEKKERRDRGCGIPDRWLKYSVAGLTPIEGTRFIAFKTPLHPYFFASEVTERHRFDVDAIVTHIASQNKTLGLVIDLTDTNRYYDPSRWIRHKVAYNKLNCPGHQVNRSEFFFETFLQIIKNFIAQNVDNDKLIGVHCTHGLNRTGYLICRYLIQEDNWTATQAIESFGSARGYPIERGAYIQSLYKIEKMINSGDCDDLEFLKT
uniref:TYR_PHOSPHATASE_2 domain-containing protein n=1 Tax=Meloidogyne incognita TaxID=6306 RepID=A0A914KJ46_MELIC